MDDRSRRCDRRTDGHARASGYGPCDAWLTSRRLCRHPGALRRVRVPDRQAHHEHEREIGSDVPPQTTKAPKRGEEVNNTALFDGAAPKMVTAKATALTRGELVVPDFC